MAENFQEKKWLEKLKKMAEKLQKNGRKTQQKKMAENPTTKNGRKTQQQKNGKKTTENITSKRRIKLPKNGGRNLRKISVNFQKVGEN